MTAVIMQHMNTFGRMAICGCISKKGNDPSKWPKGKNSLKEASSSSGVTKNIQPSS